MTQKSPDDQEGLFCMFCAMLGNSTVPAAYLATRKQDHEAVGTCQACRNILVKGDAKPEDFVRIISPDHTLN